MTSDALLALGVRERSVSQWALTWVTPLDLIGMARQRPFEAIPIFAGRD
jgi:hypothetical protein